MEEIKFTIPLNPITKKNHQEIRRNRKTGKPFISQSDQFKAYEMECGWFLKPLMIDYPINIKAIYYMETRRRVDIANLNSSLHDVLVKHRVIVDDNSKIVCGTDGSRVRHDKASPRTEITITRMEEETE